MTDASSEHHELGIEHRSNRRHRAREVLGLDRTAVSAALLFAGRSKTCLAETTFRIPRRRAFATTASADATLSSEPRRRLLASSAAGSASPEGGSRSRQQRRGLPGGAGRRGRCPSRFRCLRR